MKHLDRREALRGISLTLLGGVFWGLAGVFGQYLFEYKEMSAQWLVSVRLVLAGVLLLSTVVFKQKKATFRIWTNKKDAFRLVLFGLLGMAFCQLTYYMAVEQSNAGTATVLQYTAPVMIMVYLALRNRKMPTALEMAALVLALGGTFLLATHGNVTSLTISKSALMLGLASAVAMVLYNLLPGDLMEKYGTFSVIGWGMLIGGIFLCAIIKPWYVEGIWDWQTVACMATVIVVGTVLSFGTYMEGVRLIGAGKASLFASVEPLTATIVTVLFMNVAFVKLDLIGFACIIGAVVVLSLPKKEKESREKASVKKVAERKEAGSDGEIIIPTGE